MTELIRARNDDIECRAMEDALVILDLRTERYLSLNQSGAELWPLIVDGVTEAQLVRALNDRYGIDEEAAARDVGALVAQLRDSDLLAAGADGASG